MIAPLLGLALASTLLWAENQCYERLLLLRSGHRRPNVYCIGQTTASFMRYSLSQFMFAVGGVGSVLGFALYYSVSLGVVLVGLFALATFCIVRAKRRWPTCSLLQKAYAASTALGSCGLVAVFVVSVAASPTYARLRSVRNLQAELANDGRFSNVGIEYLESKVEFVRIDGQVKTERDLHALRQLVWKYDWRGMRSAYWHVSVIATNSDYDGWDDGLFGDDVF